MLQTLDRKNPREWYYALMDYGVSIKKKSPRLNAKSAHYTKQSKFVGSVREIRGRILKVLHVQNSVTTKKLRALVESDTERFEKAFAGLVKEKIIVMFQGKVAIAE